MIRASSAIVFFSVALISIHYAYCTRAAGGETRKQSPPHPMSKGNFHSDHKHLEKRRNIPGSYHPSRGQLPETFPSFTAAHDRYRPQPWSRKSYRRNLNVLSNWANQLSKNPGKMNQLAELVKELPDDPRALGEATPKSLTLLVHSASKLTLLEKHRRTGKRALIKLAKEMARRDMSHWTDQDLAVGTNGLSKAQGEEITGALKVIAQAVPLRKMERWTEQHLTMLTNGLSKAVGKEITETLVAIARVVRKGRKNWTELQLAILANGLSKAESDEITGALETIAQEVTLKNVKDWTEQQLAMLASGLSKTESKRITMVLKAIAKVVQRREKNWTEQYLAMLAKGLSKAEGGEITEALKVIAQEVHRRGVKRCTDQNLAMMISGLGKVPGQPVFEPLVKELVARENPKWLPVALKNVCRLQLSETQARAGLDIVKALNDTGYKPESRRTVHEIAWCITLLHFVFDQQINETSREACKLLNKYHAKLAEYSGDDTTCPGRFHRRVFNDQWQNCFVRDYWQTHQRAVPLVSYSIATPKTSHLQERISEAVREQFASYAIDMEVSINGFSIDIMIEEKICVEVDGPVHYVYSDQPGLCDSSSYDFSSYGSSSYDRTSSDPATGEAVPVIANQVQKYQRAKDHFIGYMLERYGYSVFRIPYGIDADSEQFHGVMQAIQEALDQAD